MPRKPLLSLLPALLMSIGAHAATPGNDGATLNQIRETALASDWAYERLADLTDLVGPRLSGSAGEAAAVVQVAESMRKLGAKVTLQPVKVPHWVRGVETGELVEYRGRPQGVSQKIVLTALGNSGATPAEGLTAPVIVIKSFEELKARAAEVKGRIVLFDVRFDQELADRGQAGQAYGQVTRYRGGGTRMAAEMGAVAALVSSAGGGANRSAHTGSSGLQDSARIPAAAVTVEDSLLMARLAARGPISMKLTLTPRVLPDADSFNVIADWPGTDKADEIVIVSGHLDSWDLATGANDDGAGVASAMGVIETLKKLDYHPRRTIRVIAWANEENGGRGSQAYMAANQTLMGKHFAAIETDNGSGRPFGIRSSAPVPAVKLLAPLASALESIGAGVVQRADVLGSPDLRLLEEAGVPSFTPLLDTSSYFTYHHTAADTLDKVDPQNLKRHVAFLTSLTWYLANMDQPIGRSVAAPK